MNRIIIFGKILGAMNTLAEFYEGDFYHVFNRTNNRELLFKQSENFSYFLKRYQNYLGGYVDTYAYALLPNHFHVCISIKSINEILATIGKISKEERTVVINKFYSKYSDFRDDIAPSDVISVHELISSQFRRFFISYSQAINKQFNRQGNLLNRPFKRAHINAEEKFAYVLYYIHHNARKHGFVKTFTDYPQTSYYSFFNDESSFLNKEFVFDWFGGKEEFERFHLEQHYKEKFKDFWIEE